MQVSGVVSDVSFSVPKCGALRVPESRHFHGRNFLSDSKSCVSSSSSSGFFRACPSLFGHKLESAVYKHRRARDLMVRASLNPSGDLVPLAPLDLESPVGQVLAQVLQTHPHLLPASVDQELEKLESDRDAQKMEDSKKPLNSLYKRIAEIKDKDKRVALEEIIYCLVVSKFVENGITLIPKITTTSDPIGRVDFWPNQEYKLERIHSPEAFEMIQNHVDIVLGEGSIGPLQTDVQISKIRLGKLYAASIMYGYFLKRVDERFQLEQSMKTIPTGGFKEPLPENPLWDPESLIRIPPDGEDYNEDGMDGAGGAQKLKSYVVYLDSETLQRYATIRSREAISLIEKQTQALFGRPDIRVSDDGSIDALNDEIVTVTFSGLTMLVLEAVGFGSFLWDAETYVESKYHFIKS